MNLNAYITSCKFHGELHIGLTWRLMYTSQDMNSVLIYGKGIRFLRAIGLVICLIYILEFEGNAFISMGPALMSLIITKAVDVLTKPWTSFGKPVVAPKLLCSQL